MPNLQRLQLGWYLHGALRELVLIYPAYTIMMGETGISPFELSILLAVWSGSVVLFEVPSGTLSDRFSRKWLVAAGAIIKGLCFVAWLMVPTFSGFLVGFLLWGLGSSLRSGAAEAYLHESLTELGHGEQFAKIYGRGTAVESAGVLAAFAIGGVVAETGFTLPLALSAAGPWLAAVVVAAMWVEPARIASSDLDEPQAEDGDADSLLEILTSGVREAVGNRLILAIVALSATAITVGGVLDEYVGPFLDAKQMSLTAIGLIYAGTSLASIIGALVAHRLPFSSTKATARSLSIGAGLLVVGTLLPGYFAAAALITYGLFLWSADVLLQTQLQHAIEGPARATITSCAGMGQEFVGIILYLVVGVGAEAWGWEVGVFLLATIGLLSGLAFSFSKDR